MKTLILAKYKPAILDEKVGEEILANIHSSLKSDDRVILDFRDIISMATFCAKQIFGSLYVELGSEAFFDKIVFENISDDVDSIIRIGISDAIRSRT